jgi:hypothetical protein
MPEESMMTEDQRDELKTLCQKADVPDKSGELLTQEGAQKYIDEPALDVSSPLVGFRGLIKMSALETRLPSM